MAKGNMQIENEATLIEEKDATPTAHAGDYGT
jgi:hypothetical protein